MAPSAIATPRRAQPAVYSPRLSTLQQVHGRMLDLLRVGLPGGRLGMTQHDALVEAIYQMALDDEAWPSLLARLTEHFDACSGMLLTVGAGYWAPLAHNLDPAVQEAYNGPFLGQDPWQEMLDDGSLGTAQTGQEIRPTAEFRHTAYYHHVMRPAQVWDCLGARLDVHDGEIIGLAVHRSARSEVFGRREKAELQSLIPHLRRALRLRRAWLEEKGRLALGNQLALHGDCMGPLFVVDRDSRILFATEAGAALLSAGVPFARQRDDLVPTEGVPAARFSEAVRLAVTEGRGSEIRLRRSKASSRLVSVYPCQAPAMERWGLRLGHQRAALVKLFQAAAPSPGIERQVAAMFGLTPTEARLAAWLANGGDVKGYAEAHGVAEQTVRSQLKVVLGKTACHRQAELVALLWRAVARHC